jgi:hypothetical protein
MNEHFFYSCAVALGMIGGWDLGRYQWTQRAFRAISRLLTGKR